MCNVIYNKKVIVLSLLQHLLKCLVQFRSEFRDKITFLNFNIYAFFIVFFLCSFKKGTRYVCLI